MSFRQKMFELSKRLLMEQDGGMSSGCPPDTTLTSRRYQSPLVSYVTLNPQSLIGNAEGDILLQLPIPAKAILCVNSTPGTNSDSLYMHFIPLNKSYTTVAITPTGTEQWIPICPNAYSGDYERVGWWMTFREPMPVGQGLYFDMGFESGDRGPVTFAISESFEFFRPLFA
jgi:hypothetical protein